MSLLIDGYNLLFAAGMLPRNPGPGALRRARETLLHFLLGHLTDEQVRETTVVFDAKDAPRTAVDSEFYRGLNVLYAREHEEADDLIEQLIRRAAVPRRLCVVSSDLRLRTAARRRRARAIKSEDWLDRIEKRKALRAEAAAPAPPNVTTGAQEALSGAEVARWLRMFDLADGPMPPLPGDLPPADPETARDQADAQTPPEEDGGIARAAGESDHQSSGGWGPFPPGYGEDLLEE